MASAFFWKILFSVISLSLALNWKEPICNKLILRKDSTPRWDANSRKIVMQERTRKDSIFVCCEGYREISHITILPYCHPICKQSCGYGYCYKPNQCACYNGYEVSDLDGTCKPIGSNEVVTKPISKPPPIETRFNFESSTFRIDKKPSSTVVAADFNHSKFTPYKTFSFKTTIPTTSTTEFTGLYVASTRKQINYGNKDTDIGTTNPASTHHKSFEIESSTRQIDLKPSSRFFDDFPRVKLTTYKDSSEGTRNIQNKTLKFESSATPTYEKPAILKSWSNTEFAKDQTTKSPHTQSPKFSIESKFKNPANCTSSGICTCQMGYQIIEQKFCTPCRTGSQCQCQDGYAFDSFHCRPLCNGVFDGCIRGICIEYNECSCISGTEKFNDDLFHCKYVKETNVFDHLKKINTKWYLLVLLIPVFIVGLSFYIIIKRSRSSKFNCLRAQRNNFPEIRYFHKNNDRFERKKYHGTDGQILNEPDYCEHHDGNIIIVKV